MLFWKETINKDLTFSIIFDNRYLATHVSVDGLVITVLRSRLFHTIGDQIVPIFIVIHQNIILFQKHILVEQITDIVTYFFIIRVYFYEILANLLGGIFSPRNLGIQIFKSTFTLHFDNS